MKRRKRMSRSFFALSAAGRAVLSITENTIAPVIERLGKTVARKPPTASERMSSDEIARRLAQDEQDMFDATQTLNGHPVDSAGGSP